MYIAIAFTGDMDVSDLHQIKPIFSSRKGGISEIDDSCCVRRQLSSNEVEIGERRSSNEQPRCPRRRSSGCLLLDVDEEEEEEEESSQVIQEADDTLRRKQAPPSLPRRVPSRNVLVLDDGEEEQGREEDSSREEDSDPSSHSSWTLDAEETREIYRTLSMISTNTKEDHVPCRPRRRRSINKRLYQRKENRSRVSAHAA